MKEDIVGRILLAETEYHAALEKASGKIQAYEETAQAEQSARIAQMDQQWQAYVAESQEKHRSLLQERNKQLEDALRQRKRELKMRQQGAAEALAKRLKEEVLSQYGSR